MMENPCKKCPIQAKLERIQLFYNSRWLEAINALIEDPPSLYGLNATQTDYREQYCEHCLPNIEYVNQTHNPYCATVPSDDNYVEAEQPWARVVHTYSEEWRDFDRVTGKKFTFRTTTNGLKQAMHGF